MAGKPSMMALLGLLAVAGYKHREKISDMLGDAQRNAPGGAVDDSTEQPANSILDNLKNVFTGAGAGGTLSRGLGELMQQFTQSGQQEVAESWVGKGANRSLEAGPLEQALGEDTLVELSAKTGLSRAELLQRLAANLPESVDRYTPEGKLPTEQEAARYQ